MLVAVKDLGLIFKFLTLAVKIDQHFGPQKSSHCILSIVILDPVFTQWGPFSFVVGPSVCLRISRRPPISFF